MIKVFYGCARKHRVNIDGALVITNDNDPKCYCNYTCDIRQILSGEIIPGIKLSNYDGLIFTPPCNYYSHANYRRETSTVALSTKDLLPLCLEYCIKSGKFFLVENVMNKTLLGDLYPEFQFCYGGHTFWTNLLTKKAFENLNFLKSQNKQNLCRNKRDGNYNVHIVIDLFCSKLNILKKVCFCEVE